MTRLDEDQMTRSVNSSTRSEKHGPKVKLDPDPSSSDSSDSLSSDLALKKKKIKRRKSVVSIGKMARQNHLRATTLIIPMTVIKDASNATIRNTRKSIRSD